VRGLGEDPGKKGGRGRKKDTAIIQQRKRGGPLKSVAGPELLKIQNRGGQKTREKTAQWSDSRQERGRKRRSSFEKTRVGFTYCRNDRKRERFTTFHSYGEREAPRDMGRVQTQK